MKNTQKVFLLAVIAAIGFAGLSVTSCDDGSTVSVINRAAIEGVTVPTIGGTPAALITENSQYSGTVVWTPSDEIFKSKTAYYAIITLTEKGKYTLQGVPKNFFTVAGALTVTNDENSGVITAVFPRLPGTIDDPAVIDISDIEGINPVTGERPKTEITTAQYTGTVTWSPNDNPFKVNTVYTAAITLEPKTGFTLTGVEADFFTVKNAVTTNDANSGDITAVFRVLSTIVDIDDLAAYLSAQPANTKDTPYYIALNIDDSYSWGNINHSLDTILNNAPNKYVYLDLSDSTITYTPRFSGCATLTGITIPNSVTSIGEYAFSSCTSLTSVTIGSGVTTIGDYAFSSCTSLTSVTIEGNGLADIYATNVFRDCGNLTSLTIGNGVTSIVATAFSGCGLTTIKVNDSNRAFTVENGVLYNKNKTTLIMYPPGKKDTSFTIPDSVTTIGAGAFAGCSWELSITIPDSVTSIGVNAFNGLYNVTIGNDSSFTIEGGVLYHENKTTLVMYFGSENTFTIPDSVTTIGDGAFMNCGLSNVTIGNRVTTIGNYAFYRCRLTRVTIPNSVTTIGDYAFYWCYSLASVTIGNSVTIIGDRSFMNCGNITRVTIPNSVISIGEEAFCGTGCTNLTIGNSVTTIGVRAFAGCWDLPSVTIPNSVTTIGDGAFVLCGFTSITIPNSVTTIGNYAFESCSSLRSVTFTATSKVTSIGEYAFSSCTSLTSVTIPNSVTSIGSGAFYNCTKLTSVTIPNSITTIHGKYLEEFLDAFMLYGRGTFEGCTSLTSITIPNSVTSIEWDAFNGCTSLTSITIPNSVTSIGEGTFESCTSLTSVTIPKSVTTIGYVAFGGCTSLTSVTFQGTIPSANFNYAFGYYGGAGYIGDLGEKFYATNAKNGTPGTYTRAKGSDTWTKQ